MIIVPFIPAHLDGFDLQRDQIFMSKYIGSPEYIELLSEMSESHTGIVNGEVVVIAGCLKMHEHIGMVWALLSNSSKKHMLPITRGVSGWLDSQDVPRMETAVRHDFKEGHRWAKMLGFKNETPNGMEKFGVDGETYDLYSRVN